MDKKELIETLEYMKSPDETELRVLPIGFLDKLIAHLESEPFDVLKHLREGGKIYSKTICDGRCEFVEVVRRTEVPIGLRYLMVHLNETDASIAHASAHPLDMLFEFSDWQPYEPILKDGKPVEVEID